MSKFWQLLKESVIIQASVTLIVVCAAVYLVVTGQKVPTELTSMVMLVLGFYFGAKTRQIAGS